MEEIKNYFFEIAASLSINNGETAFTQRWSSCAGAFESTPCQYTPICTTADPLMKANIKNFQFVQIEPWKPWK